MRKYIILILLFISVTGCNDQQKIDSDTGINLSKAMSDENDEGFKKAIEKIKFKFPEDHGPHPEFRTEWWYFTGNLTDAGDKKFGYQFTIFRTALSMDNADRSSDWSTDQIYMGHFAVTDISGDKFYFEEKFSRTGNQLAGAQADPLRVWLEDWQITEFRKGADSTLPVIKLNAKTGKAEIDFIIESLKPVVLQGEDGLSQKGKQPGNASYYYSYTRLKTEGKIILDGKEYNVSGASWMDREWSTSALGEDQKGWDWFALQLDDSTEIMYYQMRKNDGSPDIYSKGIIVEKSGSSYQVNKDKVILEVTDNWKSSSGVNYPSGWNLKIPSKNIDLKITPAISDQLMDVSVKYWEGAVRIQGSKDGSDVSGKGYVELTGY